MSCDFIENWSQTLYDTKKAQRSNNEQYFLVWYMVIHPILDPQKKEKKAQRINLKYLVIQREDKNTQCPTLHKQQNFLLVTVSRTQSFSQNQLDNIVILVFQESSVHDDAAAITMQVNGACDSSTYTNVSVLCN